MSAVVKMKTNNKTGPSGETDPVQVNNYIITGQVGLIWMFTYGCNGIYLMSYCREAVC